MTKMKSKKMNKSTFAVIIMAIVMVAMLAFGGTYAYFSANAVGESVGDINTAQLELLNNGTKLSYTEANQIVPGDYIFGKGKLAGTVEGIPADGWTTVDLDLGNTNAAVYAFVKVTARASSGASTDALLVKHGTGSTDADFAPVLNLIPRTGNTHVANAKSAGWQKFETSDNVGVNNSTYVFYFKIDDDEDWRTEFDEQFNFQFALQFDSRVMADRTQTTQGQATVEETTNVYSETDKTKAVAIMGVTITFTMDFKTIQQTGFKTAADAYNAAFGSGTYTDTDTVITPPGSTT